MREIKPVNNNGCIQLKFSVAGKRYTFNPVPSGRYGNTRDMATASAIATRIQNDVLSGHFDPTLNSYRLTLKIAPEQPKTKPETLLELWDGWVITLNLPVATKANHYEWVRRMLLKANPNLTDTNWLTKAGLATRTLRDRLSLLKSCGDWAVEQGWLEVNPYANLKLKRDNPKDIKPFTAKEIQTILSGFEEIAPHYLPFVKFLFLTGVRISEAIGLQWQHIDFEREIVTVRESLSIDVTDNGYKRIRKDTKTGIIRHLPMSQPLKELLETIRPSNPQPDDLVFTTVKGCIIDAGNFRDRQWIKVLTACKVPYRKIHTIRHTMISHGIEQGIPMTGVAYLAGHKDTRMVMQTYGHMVNRPQLPEMGV